MTLVHQSLEDLVINVSFIFFLYLKLAESELNSSSDTTIISLLQFASQKQNSTWSTEIPETKYAFWDPPSLVSFVRVI